MSWENTLVDAMDKRKQAGGVENVMQTAKLVSVDPPAISLCGVTVRKHIHLNPAMKKDEEGLEQLRAAFDDFLLVLDTAEEVEQLREPTSQLLDFLFEYASKEPVKAGDTVMVRQQGTEFYVTNAAGG